MAQSRKSSDASQSSEEGIIHEDPAYPTDQLIAEVVDQGDEIGVATRGLDKGKQRASNTVEEAHDVNRETWTDGQELVDRKLAEELQAEEDDKEQEQQQKPPGLGSENTPSLDFASSSKTPSTLTSREEWYASLRKPLHAPATQARYGDIDRMSEANDLQKRSRGYLNELSRERPVKRQRVTQQTPPLNIAPSKKKHRYSCIITTPTSRPVDTIGHFFGNSNRFQVLLTLKTGSHDSPHLDISISQNLEGDWSTPYNRDLAHGVTFTYPASGQDSSGRYYIEDFKYGVYGDAGSPSFPQGATLPSGDSLTRLYYMTFLSQGAVVSGQLMYEGQLITNNDHIVKPSFPADHAYTRIICSIRNNPTFLVIWYLGVHDHSRYRQGAVDQLANAIALRKSLASGLRHFDRPA